MRITALLSAFILMVEVKSYAQATIPGPASLILRNVPAASITWDADKIELKQPNTQYGYYCWNTLRIRLSDSVSLIKYDGDLIASSLSETERKEQCRRNRLKSSDFIVTLLNLGTVETHLVPDTNTVYCDSTEMLTFLDWNDDNDVATIAASRIRRVAAKCPN